MPDPRIAFVASETDEAQSALRDYIERYGNVELAQADIIVAIGGDGFMLQTLHRTMALAKPIYGIMRGTVGFLMNSAESEYRLPQRLARAQVSEVHPLRMKAFDGNQREACELAINEVSLLRQTKQAAKIRILVNDRVRLDDLVCDGILLATAAGSTAYNLSAHGPIIPLGAKILPLTPISPFRPRRWRGALLPCDVNVTFEVKDPDKRPVSATADATEVRDVVRVEVSEASDVTLRMMFDPEHALEERILSEQFMS